jgi:hypothetical protein
MATSKKSLNEKLRAKYMELVKCYLADEYDEEILVTGSNEFCIPCVDDEGNDEFLVVTFKVPTGSRDGDAYDGYAMAEDYRMKCEAKAEKAKESAKKKAEKIARDKANREAKAKAKAEHQKGEA